MELWEQEVEDLKEKNRQEDMKKKKFSGRPKIFPVNVIRICRECKRLFVRHIPGTSAIKTGWNCSDTCRKKQISRARIDSPYRNQFATPKNPPRVTERESTLKNIPTPGRFEEELWR